MFLVCVLGLQTTGTSTQGFRGPGRLASSPTNHGDLGTRYVLWTACLFAQRSGGLLDGGAATSKNPGLVLLLGAGCFRSVNDLVGTKHAKTCINQHCGFWVALGGKIHRVYGKPPELRGAPNSPIIALMWRERTTGGSLALLDSLLSSSPMGRLPPPRKGRPGVAHQVYVT